MFPGCPIRQRLLHSLWIADGLYDDRKYTLGKLKRRLWSRGYHLELLLWAIVRRLRTTGAGFDWGEVGRLDHKFQPCVFPKDLLEVPSKLLLAHLHEQGVLYHSTEEECLQDPRWLFRFPWVYSYPKNFRDEQYDPWERDSPGDSLMVLRKDWPQAISRIEMGLQQWSGTVREWTPYIHFDCGVDGQTLTLTGLPAACRQVCPRRFVEYVQTMGLS